MCGHSLRASDFGTLSNISCSADHGLENAVMQYYVQIPGKVREEKVKISILLREMEKSSEIDYVSHLTLLWNSSTSEWIFSSNSLCGEVVFTCPGQREQVHTVHSGQILALEKSMVLVILGMRFRVKSAYS